MCAGRNVRDHGILMETLRHCANLQFKPWGELGESPRHSICSVEFPLSFHAATSHPRFPKVTGYYSSSTHIEISAGKAVLRSRYNRDPAREWRCCRMYNKWVFPGTEMKTKDTSSNRRVRRMHFSQNNTK